MTFIQGLLWYIVKFIVIAAVAVGGAFCGIKLRKNHDAKIGTEVKDETK